MKRYLSTISYYGHESYNLNESDHEVITFSLEKHIIKKIIQSVGIEMEKLDQTWLTVTKSDAATLEKSQSFFKVKYTCTR